MTGYGTNPTSAVVILFQTSSGTNSIYLYIPFTTTASTTNANLVDLTSTAAPTNTLSTWDGAGALSAFNFFDMTDYNQWYSITSGTSTVLISKFIYRVASDANALGSANAQPAPASALTASLSAFTTAASTTGNKLCYASTSNGNVIYS